MLKRRFGLPPPHAGTGKRFPWSMRATCATWLWQSGMTPERIRFWGRWASTVSVMYVVIGPGGQAHLLTGAAAALGLDAFRGGEDVGPEVEEELDVGREAGPTMS